jgi:hypothetical protein
MDDKVVTETEAALRGNKGEHIAPPQDNGTKRQVGGVTVSGGLAGILRLCNASGRCRYVRQVSMQGR